MRRALGLQGEASPATKPTASPVIVHPSHPQRRRFVRDGEVPVTLIHRDHSQEENSTVHQLDATRNALREQTTAREQAERSLTEAQSTIKDLQTKLAHERLAKDEVVQRTESERRTLEEALATLREELAAERAEREKFAAERDQAVFERQELEDQLGQIALERKSNRQPKVTTVKPRQRREMVNADQQELEIVEWWVPGWKNRYR
jgi:hypothetical protein